MQIWPTQASSSTYRRKYGELAALKNGHRNEIRVPLQLDGEVRLVICTTRTFRVEMGSCFGEFELKHESDCLHEVFRRFRLFCANK